MQRAGIAGEVIVRANVGVDGVVQAASIVRSTQREFEEVALLGVQRWRFVEYAPLGAPAHQSYTVDCVIVFGFDES